MKRAKNIFAYLKKASKHRCQGIGKHHACVRIEAIADLPSKYGKFRVVAFQSTGDGKEHVAFVHGDISGIERVPVRMHSECLTGDVAWSLRCDCHDQLVSALKKIGKMPRGILLYLRQEGRGIGLVNKIKAYMLQDAGLDTFEANRALGFRDDERDFGVAAHMLHSLYVKSIRLMTNNPDKIRDLESLGIRVAERIPLDVGTTKHNRFYMQTKADKGHLLPTSAKRQRIHRPASKKKPRSN